MMSSRAFNKQVEIWSLPTPVADGFGGNTVGTPVLITTAWMKVKTLKWQRADTANGLDNTEGNIEFTMRHREDFDIKSKEYFLKYRGSEYTINTFPVNSNFTDFTITMIGVQN